MKKYLLSLCLALASIMLYAQPTITSSVAGSIGDNINFDEVDADGVSEGLAGENVTWDFGDIATTGTSFGYELVDVTDAPEFAEFPGANAAADNGVGQFGFVKITGSEYLNYGTYASGIITYYDNPEAVFVFPLSYGTTNTDDFHSSFFSGIDFERSGTTTMEVDGYGSIILPTGTYEDVIRVKVHQLYMDEADLLPSPIEYDVLLYYWYKEGVKGPLFQYYEFTTGGPFPSVVTAASVNNNILVGVEELTVTTQINIAPNPAINQISIALNEVLNNAQLVIYNTQGQIVYQEKVTTAESQLNLNIGELSAGIYQIAILNGTNRQTATFVKQ